MVLGRVSWWLLPVLFHPAGYLLALQSGNSQISGRVQDSSTSAVQEADVVVVNVRTGIERHTTSNEDGYYSVPFLTPGVYRLLIQKQDFQPFARAGIKLDADENLVLDVALSIGHVTEIINVTDEPSAIAPLLDLGTSAISGAVNSDKVENLPLKGRNSSALLMLIPGVRATRATVSQPPLESHYQFFSANGSRPGQNQFLLDGANNTNVGFNSPEYSAQVESIQEFRAQTSNFSAEYANAAGAVINIVTKGGTNEFHGSGFEYFRNDALAATDFFSNALGKRKPIFRFNQFGGTLGGPIYRNKTFFFAGYEGLRLRDPVITVTTVPTLRQRAGDFSRTFTNTGALIGIYDPLTTQPDPRRSGSYLRSAFPGNVVPASRVSPVALALQQYYPQPTSEGDRNSGLNNFFFSGPRTRPVNDITNRVDHQLSRRVMLMGRFSRSATTITSPATFTEADIGSPGYGNNPQSHTSAMAKATVSLGPAVYAEVLGSLTRFRFNRRGLSNGFNPTSLGFPRYLSDATPNLGFPAVSVDGVSGLGGYANEHDAYDRTELRANLSKLVGKHTLKLGALFAVVDFRSRQNSTQVGAYSFGKSFTQGPDPFQSGVDSGFGYATFLLGALTAGTHNAGELNSSLSQKYGGLYLQDEYKITGRLRLNLGLRYDNETPRTERANQLANFDYRSAASLTNGVQVHGGLLFPGVGGVPRGHWDSQNRNFAPRVGLAFKLAKNMIVRAGYGIYYSNSWGSGRNGNGMPQTGFTCSTLVSSSLDGGLTPNAVISDPFPRGFCKATGSTSGLLTALGQAVDIIDRNQKTPYAQSWNVMIQRRLPSDILLDAAYAGSRGTHLPGILEWNQLDPTYMALGSQLNRQVPNPFYGAIREGPLSEQTVPLGQALRPYPQYLGVSSRDATYGSSIYHALSIKVERRFSKGVSLLASYTWSKLIDDVIPSRTGFPGESFSSGTLQNYAFRRNERSLAAFDTPQTLVATAVYEIPVGRGRRWLNGKGVVESILGGWQVNAIAAIQSGPPLQITGGNASGAFAGTQRPNWSGVDATKQGPISNRLEQYFDTSAFIINAPFTFGNAPRLMPNLRAPGMANLDLSLFKVVKLRERLRLQVRGEAFNALNRVQFNTPNTNINSSAFGRISSQANSPRDVQIALKILF